MHEGDVESLDAVTVERVMVDTRKGLTEMKKYAPVPEETSPIPEGSTGHQTMTDNVYVVDNNIGDMDVDNDIGNSAVPAKQRKVSNQNQIKFRRIMLA